MESRAIKQNYLVVMPLVIAATLLWKRAARSGIGVCFRSWRAISRMTGEASNVLPSKANS